MEATVAFVHFVERVLAPAKAQRFAALAEKAKGQKKILKSLYHEFGSAIRGNATGKQPYDRVWDQPCFVFADGQGFGVAYASVREAYETVAFRDGWLILLQDGSAGIHRAEGRWDAERMIESQPQSRT
ncbi:MAG TPA: hypothetical protein VF384_05195 [Planctomycetota bacterium]